MEKLLLLHWRLKEGALLWKEACGEAAPAIACVEKLHSFFRPAGGDGDDDDSSMARWETSSPAGSCGPPLPLSRVGLDFWEVLVLFWDPLHPCRAARCSACLR